MRSKTLTFPPTDEGRVLFTTLWDGVLLGASRGETKSKDQIRREAGVQRALKAISVEAPAETPKRLVQSRVLVEAGGTVTFSIAEMEVIDQLLQKVPWGGADTLAVADLFDLLGAAPDSPREEA